MAQLECFSRPSKQSESDSTLEKSMCVARQSILGKQTKGSICFLLGHSPWRATTTFNTSLKPTRSWLGPACSSTYSRGTASVQELVVNKLFSSRAPFFRSVGGFP
jgi:hypothetical protein